MTANSSGGYVADQTNYSGYPADGYAYKLFDNSSSAYQSGSVYSSGNPTGSAQTTTASDGSTHQGVAITLDLVTRIRLSHTIITSHANYGRTPVDGTFLGSDDSSSWDVIQTFSGLSTSSDTQKHTVSITDPLRKLAYRYIRFVITKIHTSSVFNGGSLAEFRELEYYGTPEYAPEAHGVDVVVKSVPNVPNTDWLEVYYDAKDLADGSTTVNDLKPSGTATNGTATNVTVSDGAFVFDGTSDIRSTVSTFTGDQPHTMSVWVNISTSHTLGDGYICVLAPSTGENVNQVSTIRYQTDGFNLQSWGNDIQMYNLGIQKGRWYHLVVVYDGGGVTTSSKRLYIDTLQNLKFSNDATTGDEIDFANTTLSLGSRVDGTSSHLTGSIANFRLFNRALTTDEIYQLYTYQKQDFGHGTLGMTLKAGRLGIGTSEPRAALDVRGDIIGGCPAFFSATRTSGTVTSPATVVFNSIQVSRGGGFNTSTGGYTVPLSGYYFIGHHSASSTTTNYQPRLRVNDVDFNNYLSRNYSSGGSTNRPVSFSLIGYLNAGDTATIYISVGVMHSTYAGFTMYYLSS
jgi:hypothetical protein